MELFSLIYFVEIAHHFKEGLIEGVFTWDVLAIFGLEEFRDFVILLDILLTVSMLFDLVLAFYCKSGEFN